MKDTSLESYVLKWQKTRDEQLFRYIIREMLPYIQSLAKKYASNTVGITYEDLLAEGQYAVFLAAQNFNPEKANGASFKTYAYRYIEGTILKLINKEQQNAEGNAGDEPLKYAVDAHPTPENNIIYKNLLRYISDKANEMNPEYGQKIFVERVISDLTFREIASRLERVSPETARVLYHTIIAFLKEVLEENG